MGVVAGVETVRHIAGLERARTSQWRHEHAVAELKAPELCRLEKPFRAEGRSTAEVVLL